MAEFAHRRAAIAGVREPVGRDVIVERRVSRAIAAAHAERAIRPVRRARHAARGGDVGAAVRGRVECMANRP
ncbi:hypothetical protein, partial [Burkholderia pseudomallei]